ncbi:cation efflux protein [Radiomyces spectabilis]|uniref:cation efflux protein n=1 Tax=Radiomyces spectabilis TaxID=64574 RepID=UPI00221F509B|nr:cation efflux protein [Radiomyces spectabilis]KAI8372740.1 cation efflux protein [Radiomyces spectabilis]
MTHKIDEHTPLVSDSIPPPPFNGTTAIKYAPLPYSSSCTSLVSKTNETSRSAKRKIMFAACLALLFFATELTAGYFANSLALMSDAFHLLSDVASFIVALVAIYLAEKPPTKRHTFGFHRAEVIAALVSVLTIWVLTAILVKEAIARLRNPQEINAKLMCMTASIGVAVNVVLAYVLGGHHDHDGSGKHDHRAMENGEATTTASQKERNINLQAAALHVLGDLLASVGVLISSIILVFKPEMTFMDPCCTFIFSILVLYTTYHLVKDSLAVLMEGAPQHIQADAVEKSLAEIPGVVAVHDLHIWTLSPGKSSLTAHIVVAQNPLINYDEVLTSGQRIVSDQFGVLHSTLQIESDHAYFTSHCHPDLCSNRP